MLSQNRASFFDRNRMMVLSRQPCTTNTEATVAVCSDRRCLFVLSSGEGRSRVFIVVGIAAAVVVAVVDLVAAR